jgi:Golgi apparatus protein 1
MSLLTVDVLCFAAVVVHGLCSCAAAKACAEDIDRYCSVAPPEERTASSVVACLKGAHAARVALQPACKKEVFKLQLDAAEDYR